MSTLTNGVWNYLHQLGHCGNQNITPVFSSNFGNTPCMCKADEFIESHTKKLARNPEFGRYWKCEEPEKGDKWQQYDCKI